MADLRSGGGGGGASHVGAFLVHLYFSFNVVLLTTSGCTTVPSRTARYSFQAWLASVVYRVGAVAAKWFHTLVCSGRVLNAGRAGGADGACGCFCGLLPL